MSKIALSGMIVVPCFGLFVIRHRRQEITDSAPVMKSFQMVLDNKDLVRYLGPPINLKGAHHEDANNEISPTCVNVKVPFTAQKQCGGLHVWSHRESQDLDWVVNRVEVSVDSVADKRIKVFSDADSSSL